MVHKINVILSIIIMGILMIVVCPINIFCYTHPYLIPVVMIGLGIAAYIVLFLLFVGIKNKQRKNRRRRRR